MEVWSFPFNLSNQCFLILIKGSNCFMRDYFVNIILVVSQLKHFIPETTSLVISKMWSTIFLLKIDGDIWKKWEWNDSEDAQTDFHWRPQIFIGDPRFSFETPDFHGRPQIFIGDPRFSLDTPIFLLETQILGGYFLMSVSSWLGHIHYVHKVPYSLQYFFCNSSTGR